MLDQTKTKTNKEQTTITAVDYSYMIACSDIIVFCTSGFGAKKIARTNQAVDNMKDLQ